MTANPYLVHCSAGTEWHIKEVVPGSELEKKCIARAQQGKLDALALGPDECPDCIEDRRERERRMANMCSEFECPFMQLFDDDENKCAKGCQARIACNAIQNSPYEGQLRGITRSGPRPKTAA